MFQETLEITTKYPRGKLYKWQPYIYIYTHPLKFKIDPEKWWLEDEFPFKMITFGGPSLFPTGPKIPKKLIRVSPSNE